MQNVHSDPDPIVPDGTISPYVVGGGISSSEKIDKQILDYYSAEITRLLLDPTAVEYRNIELYKEIRRRYHADNKRPPMVFG